MLKKKSLLIIEDEPDIREIIRDFINHLNYVIYDADTCESAEKILNDHDIDVVFSDNHLPGKSGLKFLDEIHQRSSQKEVPAWVIISADGSPELIEKACELGALDVIQKPFKSSDLEEVLKRIERRQANPLAEIMDTVQGISGIKLGQDKQLLVETRLMRRARELGMTDPAEYITYFKANRKEEIAETISLLTTHTTEFFREPDHFDFLHDEVLPRILKDKNEIHVWSGACSSGQEVYSLAIAILEFIRVSLSSRMNSITIKILGTDIDHSSIESAKVGVYPAALVSKLQPELVKRYFDFGQNEYAGLVKVKDSVHQLCEFKQLNLLTQEYRITAIDVIFIRNVLIYFKSEDIEKIMGRLERVLAPQGVLFLGHSESISNLKTPFEGVGNSIYMLKKHLTPIQSSVKSVIRVFIIDDSLTIRKLLRSILVREAGFEVVGEAENPIQAEKLWRQLSPDLITLDIHMPEMDGITYLETLQRTDHPPIVIISSVSQEDAIHSFRCLELGAVEYIEKPDGQKLNEEGEKIRSTLKGIFKGSKIKKKEFTKAAPGQISEPSFEFKKHLIAIGASTGGVDAIRVVLESFPKNSPPIVIVQHIPPKFSKAFADRLNKSCKIRVQEAEDGMRVENSNAYVAPGGKQMRIQDKNGSLVIEITDDPPMNRHRPSVDYLFESIVNLTSDFRIAAALLTGMGADGAGGLKKLRDQGVHTIAQDEESCVVFGMPQVAISLGGADEILPLPSIGYHLFKSLT